MIQLQSSWALWKKKHVCVEPFPPPTSSNHAPLSIRCWPTGLWLPNVGHVRAAFPITSHLISSPWRADGVGSEHSDCAITLRFIGLRAGDAWRHATVMWAESSCSLLSMYAERIRQENARRQTVDRDIKRDIRITPRRQASRSNPPPLPREQNDSIRSASGRFSPR